MAKNTISVRLEVISYGGWKNLEVAIDVNQVDGKTLYLTFSAVEKILNYPPDSVRKKLASKSLETFLGGGQAFGKISGRIANVKGNNVAMLSGWWRGIIEGIKTDPGGETNTNWSPNHIRRT